MSFKTTITRRGLTAAACLATAASHAADDGPVPLRAGALTILIDLDPHRLPAIDPSLRIGAIAPKVTRGLQSFDPDMTPQPLLPRRRAVAGDGLGWVFTLRCGVSRRAGRDLTSADLRGMEMLLTTTASNRLVDHAMTVDGVVGSDFASTFPAS